MDFIIDVFKKESTKKLMVFIAFALVIYLMRSMFDLILLTFLFAYLVYSFEKFISGKLGKFMRINRVFITLIIYGVLFVSIALIIYKYIPIIINQSINIIYQIRLFKMEPDVKPMFKDILAIFKGINIGDYTSEGVNFLIGFATNIGKVSVNIFMALLLSMFFVLEKEKVREFMRRFQSSKVSGIYAYLENFGKNFVNSFAKVMQAQIINALVNSVLTVIALSFMRFPELLGLGCMVFILNLIPVAGTVISLIPLGIIAFNIGGMLKVMYVVILIAVLHAFGSYYLYPKLMAEETELPVFFIFVILIVGEHLLGIWGLLIGIPLFIFILDLMGVKVKDKKE